MSFFERLVSQGHPVVTLQQQRRMRPSISALIRPLYPHLQVSHQRNSITKQNLQDLACLYGMPYYEAKAWLWQRLCLHTAQ